MTRQKLRRDITESRVRSGRSDVSAIADRPVRTLTNEMPIQYICEATGFTRAVNPVRRLRTRTRTRTRAGTVGEDERNETERRDMTDDDARDGDDDARDDGGGGGGENGYGALRFLDAGEDDERDERGERSGGGGRGATRPVSDETEGETDRQRVKRRERTGRDADVDVSKRSTLVGIQHDEFLHAQWVFVLLLPIHCIARLALAFSFEWIHALVPCG